MCIRDRGVIDPQLGQLVPAEVVDAPQRPPVALRHAALERGVDLRRRDVHAGDAIMLEDGVVVGLAAKPETLEILRLRDRHLLGDIEMERNTHAVGREIERVEPLDGDLVERGIGAGLALLGDVLVGEDLCVALHHRALVVGGRDRRDVEHARLHRLRLAVRRHRFRATHHPDLQHALAGLVDAIDEALERNPVGRRRRDEHGSFQGDLVCAGSGARRERKAEGEPGDDGLNALAQFWAGREHGDNLLRF